MLLYIVRHGIAENPVGKNDKERSLTIEGKEIVRDLGASLHSKGIRPELIISSPYLRAVQTADLLAKGLGYSHPIEQDSRLTPNSPINYLQEILIENAGVSSLMIISHEPAVSEFASMLCTDNSKPYGFAPASICCILLESIPTIRGTLYWFSTAEELIGE